MVRTIPTFARTKYGVSPDYRGFSTYFWIAYTQTKPATINTTARKNTISTRIDSLTSRFARRVRAPHFSQ